VFRKESEISQKNGLVFFKVFLGQLDASPTAMGSSVNGFLGQYFFLLKKKSVFHKKNMSHFIKHQTIFL
jgi:hypothetical protein